jgi:exopolysaccharide biosynthesis protein
VNNGNIFGLAAHNDHGAGWAAGFTSNKDNIVNCTGKGRVGDLAQKDTPEAAPHASYYNAVKYQYLKRIQPEKNMLDWSADFYYEMEQTASKTLATGLNLKSYQWKNVPRKMHVLEIDLTSTAIDLTTAFANDIVPNPNGNKNSNNGFNIRETLSQLCARKRTEGEEVLAGINTGFFDSNDGFTRGMHIEEGEPVFINNQGVRKNLVNHTWGFTTFTDNTASCGKKEFSGKMEIAGKEYEYFSVNDTIVRLSHKTYYANLYTSRYKEVPHADHPELVNTLSKTAFYIVAKYSNGNMTVNNGYAPAVVTAIYDGRTTALDKAPYLSAADEVAVQVTGDKAAEIAAAVKVGDTIKLRADVTVDGASKPIYTQNSTMFQFLKNGKDNTASLAADSSNNTEFDPVTFAAVDQAGTKVWLVVVDGRQIDMSAGVWTSMGVKAYEMYQIAARLGAYNMTRFDGGGSTAMWAYSDGTGALVNTPADDKGERSCMNYIYIRARK